MIVYNKMKIQDKYYNNLFFRNMRINALVFSRIILVFTNIVPNIPQTLFALLDKEKSCELVFAYLLSFERFLLNNNKLFLRLDKTYTQLYFWLHKYLVRVSTFYLWLSTWDFICLTVTIKFDCSNRSISFLADLAHHSCAVVCGP